MPETMTPKERWMAAVRLEPVDRLPFWPKLGASYTRAQAAPFRTMELNAINDWIGSDKHTWIPRCVREVRKNTSIETSGDSSVRTTVYRTPGGEATMIENFDEGSQSWHPTRHPVQAVDDIGIFRELYDDVTVEFSHEGREKAKRQYEEIGGDAVTAGGIGKSPLMRWVEWLAGVENAHIFLMEYEKEVESLFDSMHRVKAYPARMQGRQ